jgi:hypothetical protein
MKKTKKPIHCWRPCGKEVVCKAIVDELLKKEHTIVWNIELVTCVSCKSKLRKHPQMANLIMKTRQPELPVIKDDKQEPKTVDQMMKEAINEMLKKRSER